MAELDPKTTDTRTDAPVASKKYEEELGDYLHLRIEEQESPERELEKRVVPATIRRGRFWRSFHIQRRILISKSSLFFKDTRKMIVVWLAIAALIALGVYLEWDSKIVGGVVLLFGLVSSAFAWLGAALLGGITLVPFVGPALASILSSSLLWIINALGYFVSIVAIKAGHGKTVLNYRLVVIVFLTGMVIGYVIGKII